MRSQTNDTTSLGCAIAAARADGINLIDLRPENRVNNVKISHDTYLPSVTDENRHARINKWKMAVQRSYGWATVKKTIPMTSKFKKSFQVHKFHPFLSKL